MEPKNRTRPLRVGMISLGCAKNLVDAEIMLGNLLKEGVEITNDAAQADAVIVNTCSFIDSAQEESVDAILESAEVRQANQRGQGLVVAGCLTQRFRDELPRLLPEVDAFMGIDQVGNVAQIIREALKRRAAKLAAPPAVTNRKKAIVGRLAELSQEGEPGDGSASKERKRVTSNSAAALVSVNQRPTYIPDYAT